MTIPAVQAIGLGHTYDTRHGRRDVLADIAFAVEPGEFVCVVGPSGVGKTTLLRALAGLQPPSEGRVEIEGRVVSGPDAAMSIVFQDYSRSLLPWMTVIDNVTLPLRGESSARERESRGKAALLEVGLTDSATAYPWQLSGGMQQRVAIARALVVRPRVLLMDEPFASVDAQTRESLEDLVLSIRDADGPAVVLITHDIDEAIYLADRVVVLGGKPAAVRAELPVPFGRGRDQLSTKAQPAFAQLRAEVHRLIGAVTE